MNSTFYFKFDRFNSTFYLLILVFYAIVISRFKSTFHVMDENRFYAQEIINYYYKEGLWHYLFTKESESLPLIQRIIFLINFKLFGTINIRYFYLNSLVFVFGITQLFYSYFKTLHFPSYLIIPVFLSIFTLNHYIIFWGTANYFLSTFFFTLLLFHLLIKRPQSYILNFLIFFLIPFGTANGFIALVLAILFSVFIRNFKLLIGFLAIFTFHYFLFFKFTYTSNFKPISGSLISILYNPFYFLKIFFSEVGAFSIISDNESLKILMASGMGIIFVGVTIYLFFRNFLFKKGNDTEKWLGLVLFFLILSVFAVTVQRYQEKSISEIMNVSWYLMFSYLSFGCVYIAVLKFSNNRLKSKIAGFVVLSAFLVFYIIQIRTGISNLYFLRNMGESNRFNFIHNQYVEENDKYRSSSVSIQKLIDKKKYTLEKSPEFEYLYKENFDYNKKNIISEISIQKNNNPYENDTLFKSDIMKVSINELPQSVDVKNTFLLLENNSGDKWIFYPYLSKKPISDFIVSAINGDFFQNRTSFTFSLAGMRREPYKMSLISPTEVLPFSNITVKSKYNNPK